MARPPAWEKTLSAVRGINEYVTTTDGISTTTYHLRSEEGQSTLTETPARQTCLSHTGTREPNLSHGNPFLTGARIYKLERFT